MSLPTPASLTAFLALSLVTIPLYSFVFSTDQFSLAQSHVPLAPTQNNAWPKGRSSFVEKPWWTASLRVGGIQKNKHKGNLTGSIPGFYKAHVLLQLLTGEPFSLAGKYSRCKSILLSSQPLPFVISRLASLWKQVRFKHLSWVYYQSSEKNKQTKRDAIKGIMSTLVGV